MSSPPHREARLRLSLVEVLIAVALCAIVTNVALPPITASLHDAQLRSQSVALYAALNTARMSAVMRGTPITVCRAEFAGDKAVCATRDADWSAGVIAYADSDGEPGFRDGGDELITEPVRFPSNVEVNLPAARGALTFFPQGGTSADEALEFRFRKRDHQGQIRSVRMTSRGQLSLATSL